MNEIIRKIEAEQMKENAPEFNVGDTVKVYAKIKEGNRERIQVFEGTVLKKQGARLPAGALHHREQSDGAQRGPEVRHQQIHGPYGSDKLERLIWAIE